jgi:hypothetical protein
MKRYLFGLIGLALLGSSPVLGQAPTALPYGGAPQAAPYSATYGGAPPVMAGPDGGCCDAGCPTCVPEHYVKKVKKVEYDCGSEDFCICYFHGFELFKGCGCENGHCGQVHKKRYLIKKVHECDEDAVKCVVSHEPACAPACEAPCQPPCTGQPGPVYHQSKH